MTPKVTDNDNGEITVTLDGRELRGWSYKTREQQREKMAQAREYVEGWCDAGETIEDLRRRLEYAYRAVHHGYTFGTFDFSILKDEAAKFVTNADVADAR